MALNVITDWVAFVSANFLLIFCFVPRFLFLILFSSWYIQLFLPTSGKHYHWNYFNWTWITPLFLEAVSTRLGKYYQHWWRACYKSFLLPRWNPRACARASQRDTCIANSLVCQAAAPYMLSYKRKRRLGDIWVHTPGSEAGWPLSFPENKLLLCCSLTLESEIHWQASTV